MANEDKINGFDYKIEVFSNYDKTEFQGCATIIDPCIVRKKYFTRTRPRNNKIFQTQEEVVQFLKIEIDEYTKEPYFTHEYGKNIGDTCERCKRVVGVNSLFIL